MFSMILLAVVAAGMVGGMGIAVRDVAGWVAEKRAAARRPKVFRG